MDAKTKDAFNEVRKFTRMAESLGRIVETFDEFEHAAATAKENEAIVAKLRAEADKLTETNRQAAKAIDENLSRAKVEAQAITAAAEAEADKMKADAREAADRIRAKANAMLEDAETKVQDAEARAQAFALDALVKAKEITDLEGRIAKAQAQINKLLGG